MHRTARSASTFAILCAICIPARAVTYNVPPDPVPTTLESGDVLNIDIGDPRFNHAYIPSIPAGATINAFSGALDITGPPSQGTLNVDGGLVVGVFHNGGAISVTSGGLATVGISNTTLRISGSGSVGGYVSAENSEIYLDGGRLLEFLSTDSTVWMTGGRLDNQGLSDEAYIYFDRTYGPVTLNVSGGSLGHFMMGEGSTLNLSGGVFERPTSSVPGPNTQLGFGIHPGSTLHVFAQSASINGAAIPGLAPGVATPLDLTGLTGQFTGVLADGSPFLFDLVPDFPTSSGPLMEPLSAPYVDAFIETTPPSAAQPQVVQVFVTLVPEPISYVLALSAALATGVVLRHSRRTGRYSI